MENEQNKMTREELRQEINDRLGNEADSIHVLLSTLDATERLANTLYSLTPGDNYEPTTEILQSIEESIINLREKANAKVSQVEQKLSEYPYFISELPDDFKFRWSTTSPSFSFPLWLFGHRKPKDLPPAFHKKHSYVREQQFWNAVVRRVMECDPERDVSFKIPKEAFIEIRFCTRLHNVRHPHNYRVFALVNALAYNGLVFFNHSTRLSYSLTWEEVTSASSEHVDVVIQYGRTV